MWFGIYTGKDLEEQPLDYLNALKNLMDTPSAAYNHK